MKPSIVASVLMVAVMPMISSFMLPNVRFSAHIQGIENRDVSSTGIRGDEFSMMTIETTGKHVKVTHFEIILARGKSPVERASVTGDTFDLNKFKGPAKPGDRIVVEVKTVSGSDKELTGDERLIKIPIR